ncbi:MAG TPA: hypothetical protein VGS20_08570 [Candidatus Acidoferrales bacterium]|nr:hypothetical protein [Candidatus Acidoferrales bacterium]
MLVVWEPILATDWEMPSGSTLGRVSDARARQFWDPKHVISAALSEGDKQGSLQSRPNSGGGYYWDEAIVYGPQSRWERAPTATFWQGPVYRVIPGLEAALAAGRGAGGR